MSKKTTATTSSHHARTARTAEASSATKGTSASAPAAPADAPGAAPASAEVAPSPAEAKTFPAAPTSSPEAPTGHDGTGTTAAPDEKKGGSVQIVTRFPAELAARLDGFLDSLRNGRFGLRVSRADAVRILVSEGLAKFELEKGWPATVTHDGKTYRHTGKVGRDRKTGIPCAEYEAPDSSRVWRDADGKVTSE